MSSVNVKKDEIDLLRSFFTTDELVFKNPSLIEEFDLLGSQNLPIEDKDVHMTLNIDFPKVSFSFMLYFLV